MTVRCDSKKVKDTGCLPGKETAQANSQWEVARHWGRAGSGSLRVEEEAGIKLGLGGLRGSTDEGLIFPQEHLSSQSRTPRVLTIYVPRLNSSPFPDLPSKKSPFSPVRRKKQFFAVAKWSYIPTTLRSLRAERSWPSL